eukprot:gene19611-biopygen6195
MECAVAAAKILLFEEEGIDDAVEAIGPLSCCPIAYGEAPRYDLDSNSGSMVPVSLCEDLFLRQPTLAPAARRQYNQALTLTLKLTLVVNMSMVYETLSPVCKPPHPHTTPTPKYPQDSAVEGRHPHIVTPVPQAT